MRRRTFLGLALTAPAVAVGLPVVTPAWARPRPVPPSVSHVRLSGVHRPTAASLRLPGAGSRAPLVLTAAQDSAAFSLLGVTWLPDPEVDVEVRVRTRRDGRWSPWQPLDPQGEHRAEGAEADGVRDGTAPRWTGPSDGVQVRVDSRGPRPRDLRLELVDPGTSPADAGVTPRSTASAATGMPDVITRKQWGADESIRTGEPSYNATVRVGFVHHTASSNDYTEDQAAAMVRGIYAYHVKSNGWSDLGYNYLVDRFGRAYEGRAGGLDRFVFGAHTGGFNRDSFAVSLLGDFTTVPPTQAVLDTTADLLAWKLGQAHREPLATAFLTSAGGGTSKYAAGTRVEFDVVSGHRDAGRTTCPGQTTYDRLGDVRTATGAVLGAGFVDPVVTGETDVAEGATGTVELTAAVREDLEWVFRVTDARTGDVLRSGRGATVDGDVPGGSWDYTDSGGEPVRPGKYVLSLDGTTGGDTATPVEVDVVVEGRPCRGTPIQRAVCKTEKRG